MKRTIYKLFSYSLIIALFSLSLGFLLNDFVRGYGVVACFYMAMGLAKWVQKEFEYD